MYSCDSGPALPSLRNEAALRMIISRLLKSWAMLPASPATGSAARESDVGRATDFLPLLNRVPSPTVRGSGSRSDYHSIGKLSISFTARQLRLRGHPLSP